MPNHLTLTLLLALVLALICCASTFVNARQNNNTELNVFLIPHSHCDPGWLLTVEQYYNGAVRHTLDSVTESLTKNPDRRFIWVETSFFSIWWSRTSEEKRSKFRRLLEKRQVEFILGGWVMNDEASPTYSANIDQMTHGHIFLKNLFGDLGVPRIGWDIDPFGASQANARMYKEMGFDYHVINRVDYRVKEQMIKDASLEFNWKVSKGESILTHVLYKHYSSIDPYINSPPGFEWEGAYPCCNPNPWDNPPITDSNVGQRAEVLVNILKTRAKSFRTNNLMVPFGDDFEFRDAEINFGNMSPLVKYINANKNKFNVNIKYSLLSEYFDAIRNQSAKFPTYNYDFFPYADNEASDWTGYYTSRPELKHVARTSEHVTRSVEMLFTLAQSTQKDPTTKYKDSYERLSNLRSANGYIQHHDGITGTETSEVVQMYIDYINTAFADLSSVVHGSLQVLTSKKNLPSPLSYIQGNDFRKVAPNQLVPILLFNSLGWSRRYVVRLFTSSKNIVVLNKDGQKLVIDVNLVADNSYEIVFVTDQPVPAVGLTTYFLKVDGENRRQSIEQYSKVATNPSQIVISNPVYEVQFCNFGKTQQRLCRIKNKVSGVGLNLEQNLLQYTSMARRDVQNSGAYIFRSDGSPKAPVSTTITTTVTNGRHVQEVTQFFSPYAKQVVRLYSVKDDSIQSMNNFVEIEFEIGEMPEDRELVTVFSSNITSQGQLYTDNNGYSTLQRKTNPKASFSANYFPICKSSYIKDTRSQFTILTDQSRGIASLKDGELEVMLHRRTSHDDGRGLGRPLDDQTVTTVTLRLLVDTPERSLAIRHSQSHILNYPIETFRVDTSSKAWNQLQIDTTNLYQELFTTWLSAVSHDLPSGVHLMTLQSFSPDDSSVLLLRLHNTYEEDESAQIETVQVDDFFDRDMLRISSYEETLLSANQPKKSSSKRPSDSFAVSLRPSQIRTFALKLQP